MGCCRVGSAAMTSTEKTIWYNGFGRVDLRRQGKLPLTVIPSRPLCLSRRIEVPARQEKG